MKNKLILFITLCVLFLSSSGIANAITLSERDELNNATPGTQKVGLGTIVRSQLAVGVEVLFTGDTSVSLSVEPSGDTGYVRKFTNGENVATLLGDGSPGQFLNIAFVSDGGGDYEVTPDTASGFRAITFADAGDVATLKFINSTVGWVVVGTADVSSGPLLTAPTATSNPGFK